MSPIADTDAASWEIENGFRFPVNPDESLPVAVNGGPSSGREISVIPMTTGNDVTQLPRAAGRSLQACSLAAFISCLLMLTWTLVPLFTGGGSFDLTTVNRRVLMPLGLVFLHVAGVVLTASIVAAMFAQASWRSERMAVGPLFAGVLLFGAEAMLLWRIWIAAGGADRADPVLWLLAGIAVSFLSTWLLLEPLLRLPRNLSDAARLDGLPFCGLYWHVLLPRIKTRMLVASILPFAAALAYVLPALAVGR